MSQTREEQPHRAYRHDADDQSGGRRTLTQELFVLAIIFGAILALHAPLLRLPYFWDEAGYYIPAARDLLLTGSVIPHSTASNAHPPLVMAYLALCWKLLGFTPVVTRIAMLLVAAFSLTGFFRMAQRVSNRQIAIAATFCTALYPVFFVQSSFAQVDLAAAGLCFWGLDAYLQGRCDISAIWFSLAVLAKETAVVFPVAILGWALIAWIFARRAAFRTVRAKVSGRSFLLVLPFFMLVAWYTYHYLKTGVVFGNREFFRYNVESTLNPLRIALTLPMRLWQAFGYLGLYVLTLAGVAAMWRAPLADHGHERPRIEVPVQGIFLSVLVAYVVGLSFIGGAVLARYMLPVVPLVILVWVSTLWRRVRFWRAVVGIAVVAFLVALFVNPPYGFTLEDNLAYRDYIQLHQRAESMIEQRYSKASVLTAWPATDELSHPYLGYVKRPLRVVQMEDFTVEQLLSAAEQRNRYDVALVFSTKYVPSHQWISSARWIELKSRFFGYHQDVPPKAAAQILGGRLVFEDVRDGQWAGIVEIEKAIDAKISEAADSTVAKLTSDGTNGSSR